MNPTTTRRLGAPIALALALLVGATGCGSDDATASGGAQTTEPAGPGTTAPGGSTPAENATFPITVEADNGEVTIEERPTAIVSLSPSITEMLYAVGAGDQVAAVDSSSNVPADAPVTDLSGFRPNVEAIGALDPDLVLLARDKDDVAATLEQVGITVVLLESPDSLDELYDQVRTIGEATGHPDAAETLAGDMEADIDALIADVPERAEPLTYFYELSDDYYTLTSDSFVGSALALARFENIADDVDPEAGSFPQLTAEHVLNADPDVILVAHSDGSAPDVDDLADRPGWGELTAVTEDQVVLLDPDLASRWGPRIVDLLATILDETADND